MDWSPWRSGLLDALKVDPLDPTTWDRSGVQILFEPTFHVDAAVTVLGDDDHGGLVEMSMLLRGRGEIMRRMGVRGMAPEALRIARFQADMGADRFRALLTDLRAFGVETRPDEGGRDGITVSGALLDGRTFVSFAAWSPPRASQETRFALRMLDEALRWFPSERVNLLAIAEYFRDS